MAAQMRADLEAQAKPSGWLAVRAFVAECEVARFRRVNALTRQRADWTRVFRCQSVSARVGED